MVRLLRRLPWEDDQTDFDFDRPLRDIMWLAKRIAIDYLRWKNPKLWGQAAADTLLGEMAAPEPGSEGESLLRVVNEALGEIDFSDRQRQALKALIDNCDEIGYDRNQRVAEMTGTTKTAARSALRAALPKLQEYLAERGW